MKKIELKNKTTKATDTVSVAFKNIREVQYGYI